MPELHLMVEKKRESLQQGILALATQTERALYGSLEVLRDRDTALADAIVAGDLDINQARRALEQESLVILAAHQPAGPDLRMIGASLEMIAEIERIADHAADVAKILGQCDGAMPCDDILSRIHMLGEQAIGMFVEVMGAYARGGDEAMARTAANREVRVDLSAQAVMEAITRWMCEDPGAATIGVQLLWIVHHYERVADRATNIAERVVYIASGETPDLS